MSHKKLVSFRLPEDLMEDLRVRADIDGISVTELVCRFLRQGLQVDEQKSETLMSSRLASLEAEIQQLRQAQRAAKTAPSYPVAPTPLYALITSNGTPITNHDTQERIDRLERLMEKFAAHSGFDNLDTNADTGEREPGTSGQATARFKRDD